MRSPSIAFLAALLALAAAVATQATASGAAPSGAQVAPAADAATPAPAAGAAEAAGTTDARSPEDQARRAKLLARVGTRTVTVGDFEDQLSSPAVPAPARAGYADPARVKQELDDRVERMALAEWAIRQGIDKRSDLQREVRKLLRGITLYRQIHLSVTEESISDADVAAYYQEHSELYNRPETVNAGLVLLADRNAAQAALGRALAAKGNRAELTKIVRELSTDDDSKRRGGSLGYFDRDGKLSRVLGAGQPEPPPVDPAIVAAAFSLTNPFDVYGEVVDTARGPAVVFILNRTPAVTRTLEEVAQRIRLELVNQRRDQQRDQYLAEARARFNVRVNDANFEQVVIAPSPPERQMNPHGGMGGDPMSGPMGGPMSGPMPLPPPVPTP